jgi:hypothetical protein
MNYEMQKLAKIATSAQFNIDLSKLSKITRNRLIKGFELGYLSMNSGDASLYYGILSDHLKIPTIQFSMKDKYWDNLITKNMSSKGIPSLSNWWKADRVLFRMDKPEQWNRYITSGGWYMTAYINEPDWNNDVSVCILSDKSLSNFEEIAKSYVDTEEYQEKKNQVLEMLKHGEVITFNYVL